MKKDFVITQGVNISNATVNEAGEKAFKELEYTGGLRKIRESNGFLGMITKVLHFRGNRKKDIMEQV